MHLLLLTREFPPNVFGGVAYHAYNLARELDTAGHEVTVLTTTSGDHTTSAGESLDGVDVLRMDCPTAVSPRIWFDRAVREKLTETDLLDRVDIVHSHEYVRFDRLPTETPALLKIHFNIRRKLEFFPFADYPHGTRFLLDVILRYGVTPLERRLARDALTAADGRLFISELTRRESQPLTATNQNNTVIYNGVDLDRFERVPDSTDEYFLFVGGTQRRKGYEQVLDAFRQTGAPLKIAGAKRPAGTDVPNNIEFLGYVDQRELPKLYGNARALVHPALYEPFGNVVLESLACGTPVLVPDGQYCGAAEILTEEVSVTIDPEQPETLREAISEFVPAEFSAATCRSVATQYSWEDVATATVAFASSLR